MRTLSRPFVAMLALATLTLGGCGGSQVGTQGSVAPAAVITLIGQKPNSSANPMTVSVRSGADVLMSGKDSDGRGVALKTFQWTQTSGPALPAVPDPGALLYTTSNTVDFRAPDVASPTTLGFRLTVTNAEGTSSTADVNVTVEPGSDPDEFLGPPTAPHRFTVAVVTSQGMSGLSADVPVCVSVARQIQYTDRSGNPQTVTLPQDPSLEADATWSASLGGAATSSGVQNAVNSYTNPRAVFEIPSLNDQYLFAMFNQPVAGDTSAQLDALIAQELVPADEDSATLHLTVTATPGSCDGTVTAPVLAGKSLIVTVLDSSGKVALQSPPAAAGAPAVLSQDAGGAPLTADGLLGALTPANSSAQIQTAASANAYYQAIDPLGVKTTLQGWLQANCFDPNVSDYGVKEAGANGVHAVYTNNFDLGFGRDMYVIKCAADHTDSATGTVTAHAGDLAAIVFNYPSLELAVLRQNPINGVAMEWSTAEDGSNPGYRFTKFYIFAPDDRTGAFKRIAGANFDHRGVKLVPGACTVCHGGSLPSLQAGFAAGSAYPVIHDPTSSTTCTQSSATGCLPPGDVDAAFLPWDMASLLFSDTDPSFKGNLVGGSNATQAAEQASIKQLNSFVYETYQPEFIAGTSVDRFAAGRDLIEQWYGGPGLPNAAYSDSGTPPGWQTSSTAESVYHDVFARNCRACHTVNPTPAVQFSGFGIVQNDGYDGFMSEFSPTGLGKRYVFQETLMPDARLTTDRFWVNEQGGTSAATTLAQATGDTDLLGTDQNAVPTGQPVIADIKVNAQSADATTGKFSVNQSAGARIDSSDSYFIAKYDWTLCRIPTGGSACGSQPLAGATTADPGFNTDLPGNYQLTLAATSGLGQTATRTFEIDVADAGPQPSQAGDCPAGLTASYSSTQAGTAKAIDISTCFQSTSLLNPPYTLAVSKDGVTYGSTATGPSSSWDATVVPGAPLSGISFNFNPSATGDATVYYELCDAYDVCSTGSPTVTPAGSLSLTSAFLVAYWSNSNWTLGTAWLPTSAVPINSGPSMSLADLGTSYIHLSVPSTSTVTVAFDNPSSGSLSPANTLSGNPANLQSQLSSLAYQPPSALLTCDANGNDLLTGSSSCPTSSLTATSCPTSSHIWFTDSLSSSGYSSQTSCVQIELRALTSFSRSQTQSGLPTIYALLSTPGTTVAAAGQSCSSSSCHTGVSLGTSIWTYVGSDPSTTYGNINGSGTIIRGDPAHSPFYTEPCEGSPATTMPQVFSPSDSECQIIYQWILEGAPND